MSFVYIVRPCLRNQKTITKTKTRDTLISALIPSVLLLLLWSRTPGCWGLVLLGIACLGFQFVSFSSLFHGCLLVPSHGFKHIYPTQMPRMEGCSEINEVFPAGNEPLEISIQETKTLFRHP